DYLAEICSKLNIILVHFSTDYVFSGRQKTGYLEKYFDHQPVNTYGRSKLLGEVAIKKWANKGLKYYLIRSAWLFGPFSHSRQHKNFVDTILRLAKEKDEIKVVNDQFGCPTYSLDLAKAVERLIIEKHPFGIYHLINDGFASWCDFAKKIVQIAEEKTKIIPCSSKEYPRPAKRPKYSILLNTKCFKLRKWEEALKDYLKIKNTIL
ncbi:MAG: NAD(P)-dependent oxidoreductase, partial [Patescibacteria group bacterium]|nr:NAD(P)-dependent oxidoreductase [Patescibacteria group bacterium]